MRYLLRTRNTFVLSLICSAAWLSAVRPAQATIIVTSNSNANSLASAVTALGGPGIVVTNASLSGRSSGPALSTGTYSADGATYGLLGTGIVLSSGNALSYGSGTNTNSQFSTSYGIGATAAQNVLLTPISGQLTHFDVTELSITFNTLPGFDRVFVNVVYGSEEFPEFLASTEIDPFAIFLNNTNIAISGGFPLTSKHPDFTSIPGTELDGVLAPGGKPIVTYSALVGSGTTGNTLRFVIADAVDSQLDSTAYISALGGSTLQTIPEPNSLAIWSIGVAVLAHMRVRKCFGARPVNRR